MHVTAILSHADEGGFTAFNLETGTTTQGETIDEALVNLREAVELYLEEFPMATRAAPFVTTFDVAVHA
jgi:predicted RNase H-like HicB family nuclease